MADALPSSRHNLSESTVFRVYIDLLPWRATYAQTPTELFPILDFFRDFLVTKVEWDILLSIIFRPSVRISAFGMG